jgi:[ribosomal protein S5]-alanine N-acetyltransferase
MPVSFCFTDSEISEKTKSNRHQAFQFMIETERLFLKPLSLQQLEKYIRCDNSLERELKLALGNRSIPSYFKIKLQEQMLPRVADPSKNYLFSTLWTGISKADHRMVGELCFKGEPNAKGEIELGYGMYEDFKNQGFMTEMLEAIISWAQTQAEVTVIVASSEKSNFASSKILVKNGFEINGMDENYFHWIHPMH